MTARAEFIRPSSLAAIELCPGRPVMEARALAAVPAIGRLERAVARQGTLGHEAIAQTLALIYHGPARKAPGLALAQMAEAMAGLQEWTRDGVRRCVAYVVALMDDLERDGRAPVLHVELKLSGKGINVPRGGTADVVIVAGDLVIVEDHKLGFLDQGDAADHLQLGAYAVMAWDRFRPREVQVHLAQGRIRAFTAATFDAAAIEATRRRCALAVAGAEQAAPLLRPSIDACRYCKAITNCRALRERIMIATDELALLGAEPEDRLRLAEDAALARRFAEEARELAKTWSAEREGEVVP